MDYDALVVGSGFGGTVAATTLARARKRVLILERGTWWTSPEELGSPPRAEEGRPRLAEWLKQADEPVQYWPRPDHKDGLLYLFAANRTKRNKDGIYKIPSFDEATGVKRKLIDWALRVGERVSAKEPDGESIPAGLRLQHRVADKLVYSKVKAKLGGRLRLPISGGAPLAKEIAEFFHVLDILILEGYGQTEETTASNVNRPDRFKFGTVGPAIPGIDVAIAEDPDADRCAVAVPDVHVRRREGAAQVGPDEARSPGDDDLHAHSSTRSPLEHRAAQRLSASSSTARASKGPASSCSRTVAPAWTPQ